VTSLLWFLLFAGGATYLAYRRSSLATATVAYGLALLAYSWFGAASLAWLIALWLVFAGLVLLNVAPIRQRYVTKPFLITYRRMLPSMSDTERDALEAGTVWWDGELFTGAPNWTLLMEGDAPRLSAEEQAFLDGPCEELCRMLDDWDITHKRGDLPPEVWEFLKRRGFFAMIIPKRYGGLEFSAYAHSCVLVKVASRSATASSTIAVPNSLGPGELLLHYGTEEQKEHYLPRLACGDEVPCFALTGPRAGSDASSIPDTGVVCKGTYEGREVVGIRLNFSKRYITLAPIATVIGLAFRLYDPDKLLGNDKTDYGITCALIPRRTPGVRIGRRHFPINVPFQNGPIEGRDVFVPLDTIIGGPAMAGQGWRMLVEQLSVGRCISLPSNATGGAKAAVFASGAYTRIRRQFNMPVGRFQGVQEALARMTGNTYIMDAGRSVTTAAIDVGEKPAVPAGILKYHITELGRDVANDAMDVHGGKGICLGPRNYLARGYQVVPVAITVEGAKHPDAQPDDLRAGRDPLSSVRAQGNERGPQQGSRAGARRFRRSAVRTHRLYAVERRALAGHGADARALLESAGHGPDPSLLSARESLQRLVRIRDRCRDAVARRLSQEGRESVGAARRRVVRAVSGLDGAQAPREPGSAGNRPADCGVGLSCAALQGAGAVAQFPEKFSESRARGVDAHLHLPAWPHVLRAQRPARAQRGRGNH
jgi:acyl-CoA dehydrogenase